MEITGDSEIWDMGILYNGVGWFLGENLFEEKVLPKPLSKTFLGGCCRFIWLIWWGGGKGKIPWSTV